MFMDITGIDLFDQNVGIAVKLESRSALSPFASCCYLLPD